MTGTYPPFSAIHKCPLSGIAITMCTDNIGQKLTIIGIIDKQIQHALMSDTMISC